LSSCPINKSETTNLIGGIGQYIIKILLLYRELMQHNVTKKHHGDQRF